MSRHRTGVSTSQVVNQIVFNEPSSYFIGDSHFSASPRTSSAQPSHLPTDSKQLSAGMTATLSAELQGRVPVGLIAEIVRAVLDESRNGAQRRDADVTMLEARLRVERFIRARASR